jgi:hypothetical protein
MLLVWATLIGMLIEMPGRLGLPTLLPPRMAAMARRSSVASGTRLRMVRVDMAKFLSCCELEGAGRLGGRRGGASVQ